MPERKFVQRILLTFITLAIACVGCTQERRSDYESIRFELLDYDGAGGLGYKHTVNESHYSIDLHVDRGRTVRRVWNTGLGHIQARKLRHLLSSTDWQQLKPSYEDADVWDGLQITFVIGIDEDHDYQINVRNVYRPELAEITDLLDSMSPEQYHVRYSTYFSDEQVINKPAMHNGKAELLKEGDGAAATEDSDVFDFD